MKKSSLLFSLCFFINSIFSQSGDLNMHIVAHVPSPEGGSGIWHYVDRNGIEYAALGTKSALVIYSLEDPSKPIERARVNGVNTIWREVFFYRDHIYAVTDNSSDGLVIVNMKNAPSNITSKFWTTNITTGGQTGDITTCHTVFVDEKGILCLNGCNPWRGVLFFDLNVDPENPKFLGSETARYSHDVFMRNDTLWSSDILDGLLSIWDVKDKTNPIELATVTTPFAFTHNAWISDDAKYVFTTDERNNAFVAAYDVSDLSNIKLLDQWRPKDTEGSGVIPHNTRYLNGYLITSYYTDGVKIVDAHRPENLIEVGSVDTYFGNQIGFHGCWGVSPYLPSGTIVASDIEGGLYVISADYIRACYLEGIVSDSTTGEAIADASITIHAHRVNGEQSNLNGEYKTGYANAGAYMVTYSHPDFIPQTIEVGLENGVVTIKNVKLLRKQQIVQRFVVKDKSTGLPVPQAHVTLQNSTSLLEGLTDNNGIVYISLAQDNEVYNLYAGKWTYFHKQLDFNSLAPTSEIVILLEKGYQDDFVFDQEWSVQGNAVSGQWIRVEPKGTNSNGRVIQTDEDVQTDFGDKCFVTGNNSEDPAEDDVDGGNTILISPVMDLSTYRLPLLNYAYWFVNTGGNNNPNDRLQFKLISGNDTFLIRNVRQSDSVWRYEVNFNVKNSGLDLHQIQFLAETMDTAPGHLVEAALDAFIIIEGNPVSNDEITSTEFEASIQPNIFTNETVVNINYNNTTPVELNIYDLNGVLHANYKLSSAQNKYIIGKELNSGFYVASFVVNNEIKKQLKLIKY